VQTSAAPYSTVSRFAETLSHKQHIWRAD